MSPKLASRSEFWRPRVQRLARHRLAGPPFSAIADARRPPRRRNWASRVLPSSPRPPSPPHPRRCPPRRCRPRRPPPPGFCFGDGHFTARFRRPRRRAAAAQLHFCRPPARCRLLAPLGFSRRNPRHHTPARLRRRLRERPESQRVGFGRRRRVCSLIGGAGTPSPRFFLSWLPSLDPRPPPPPAAAGVAGAGPAVGVDAPTAIDLPEPAAAHPRDPAVIRDLPTF